MSPITVMAAQHGGKNGGRPTAVGQGVVRHIGYPVLMRMPP
jgi:hypothetical protein